MNRREQLVRLLVAGFVLGCSLMPLVGGAVCNPHIPLNRPDARYSGSPDGTVTDRVTGLMWKQCAEGLSSQLAPCDSGTAETYTWQQALDHADDVNNGRAGVNAGYSDWRVPTLRELKTLAELACYNPAINERYFPNTPVRQFWSATPVAAVPGNAWGIGFFYGGDAWAEQEVKHHLRLVRGAGAVPDQP